MRQRLRLSALALAALLASLPAAADPTGSYLYAIPYGGIAIFDGKLRVSDVPLRDAPEAGLHIGYQWLDWLALEATGGYAPTKHDDRAAAGVNFMHAGAGLTFTPWTAPIGGPFIHLGAAASRLKEKDGDFTDDMGNLALGAGLRFWAGDRFGVRLEARDLAWLSKDKVSKVLAHTITFDVGLIATFGARPRDTDRDGVSDRKDRCPDTPLGARVDPAGCPIDSDKDGVFDGIDQCENTPAGATVDARGCPSDADGDGVFDGIDQCADTPKGATVSPVGCPSDADADSVLDGIDQCPDTPKGAVVDERGCPRDGDSDGVPDGIDKCPDTGAGLKVDPTGCPIEVVERETEMLDTGMIRLQNITFETGKADLKPEALPQLDIVGQLLTRWPDLKIEIGGHTDSRGSDAANLKLSQARVDSVLTYLVGRFPDLNREQFTTKGYGESKPLVPNTSPLNMQRNRRVEFRVLNTDVLRREIERRKLLQK